ncbi:glycosyltransferase family 2 protein [Cypionkella sp.]|uniref:glycosyltransferase family 2 protein n=1 Tax=Cypionkella sp. TaxID=2811411 RepID=UPI002FDC9D8D
MRTTVLASMRNEGAFLVEWVTWYRMLGFANVAVVTNNCTDRSPELLDALEAAGWVHHLRHDLPAGARITRAKLAAAMELRVVRRAEWLLICDVDEFLVIHRGKGLLPDLIDSGKDPAYVGMSINWRVFGTSGVKSFEDRPVHRQFVYACPRNAYVSRFVKSIFRMPRRFGKLTEHTPCQIDLANFGKAWGDSGMAWVNSEGRRLTRWSPLKSHMTVLPPSHVTHKVAQINHYTLRSAESFSLKAGTLSPVALNDRYTEKYFDAAEAGTEVDTSAFRYADAFQAEYARAMALPDVARLHALCCADHIRAIVEKAGGRAEDDPRYQDFIEQAAKLA